MDFTVWPIGPVANVMQRSCSRDPMFVSQALGLTSRVVVVREKTARGFESTT